MILTTHALIGAAIGKNVDNFWLIPAITIPLHFLMDNFRHGEYLDRNSKIYNTWWKIALDLAAAFAIVFGIAYFKNFDFHMILMVFSGMFFSMLPDLTTLLYWEFHLNFLGKIHNFHVWCHRYPPFSKQRQWNLRNAYNDIIFSIIAIIILLL
jgi:hypothetical protein